MAVPKKRRSKSKKRLKKQCWKKKAETQAKIAYALYKSEAKILLVGSGADEQCAGYSRHKTKYRSGGYALIGKSCAFCSVKFFNL